MYSEHALGSGYYCDVTTISGTDPRIRKEMDDYFAQKKENKDNYQSDSLPLLTVNIWYDIVLLVLICCLSAWSLFLVFR